MKSKYRVQLLCSACMWRVARATGRSVEWRLRERCGAKAHQAAMQGMVERATPAERPTKANDGSLLRLFRSSYFDPWMAFLYIYRHPQTGVVDYISNHMYSFEDADIEFYLPQLCHLLIHMLPEQSSLERFLVDKCLQSSHFALKATWWLRSYLEEADPTLRKRLETLIGDCEYAAIHQKRLDRRSLRSQSPQPPKSLPPKTSISSASASVPDTSSAPSSLRTDAARSESDLSNATAPGPASLAPAETGNGALSPTEQARSERFENMAWFVNELGALSERLRRVPIPQRAQRLQEEIAALNAVLFAPLGQSLQAISLAAQNTAPSTPRRSSVSASAPPALVVASPDSPAAPLPLPPSRGLYLPVWSPSQSPHTIVHVLPTECHVLNSRERVPYITYVEVVDAPSASGVPSTPPSSPAPAQANSSAPTTSSAEAAQQDAVRNELARLMAHVQTYEKNELHASTAGRDSTPAIDAAAVAAAGPAHGRNGSLDGRTHSSFNSTPDDSVSAVLPFGETIEVRTERVRRRCVSV